MIKRHYYQFEEKNKSLHTIFDTNLCVCMYIHMFRENREIKI